MRMISICLRHEVLHANGVINTGSVTLNLIPEKYLNRNSCSLERKPVEISVLMHTVTAKEKIDKVCTHMTDCTRNLDLHIDTDLRFDMHVSKIIKSPQNKLQ